jgi:hypothetical protein
VEINVEGSLGVSRRMKIISHFLRVREEGCSGEGESPDSVSESWNIPGRVEGAEYLIGR